MDEVVVVVGVVQLGELVSRACATPAAPSFGGVAHSTIPSVEPGFAADDNVHPVVRDQ